MGDLRPLGSEKLQGMDKIQRILEIARFKENLPSSLNETSKSEYSLALADGNTYQIVREKAGYIIKQTISENTNEYIAPIQDRTYFKSYSQALKRLNLMAKEMNTKFGNEVGTSLFSEQKKYVLKTPNSEKKNINITDDVENVPAPEMPSAIPSVPAAQSAAPETPTDDVEPTSGGEDMGMGDEHITPSTDSGAGEPVSFKLIQKLTGKLGQKLRALNADEQNKMSSKDIKYVINSVLSALNLDELSDEDKEDILNKFEGIEADESMGTGEESPMEPETTGEESPMEPETTGEEGISTDLGEDSWDESPEMSEEDDDNSHINRIADSIFMENKVEDVLMKYFRITESEKEFNQKVQKERKKITRSQLDSEVKRLSESKNQELRAKKFLRENSSAKFIGKTNKNNLIFEMENKHYKISVEGSLKWSI